MTCGAESRKRPLKARKMPPGQKSKLVLAAMQRYEEMGLVQPGDTHYREIINRIRRNDGTLEQEG